MKKIFVVLIIAFSIFPMIVKANIICNDGTTSSSCETCHTGCCSGHDGCTDNPHKNNNKNSKLISKKKQKKNKTNSFVTIIIGILTYAISIILLLILDNKFNIEDKIVSFIEKHDLFILLLYVSFLGLVLSLGWISIPMYIAQHYTIYHEIGSIILLTFVSYCFIIIEQN